MTDQTSMAYTTLNKMVTVFINNCYNDDAAAAAAINASFV